MRLLEVVPERAERSGELPSKPGREPRSDPAVTQPQLDERVEGVPVAVGGADAGVDDSGDSGQPGGGPRVLEVPAEQPPHDPAVLGARPARVTGRQAPGRGAAGR